MTFIDQLQEAARRGKSLREALAHAPACDIVGVVSCKGAGGSHTPGFPWILDFALENWRRPGCPLENSQIAISKEVAEHDIRAEMDRIKPCDVLHMRVRMSAEDKTNALLIEIVGPHASDAELSRVAQQLQQPVTIEVADFGEFRLNRQVDWFEIITTWRSERVELSIEAEGQSVSQAALMAARSLWAAQEEWHQRAIDCATRQLLDLKNDAWLQDDEAPVTPQVFRDRLHLRSISVFGGKAFELWFDDGDLFWGHSIKVSGNLASTELSADLAG